MNCSRRREGEAEEGDYGWLRREIFVDFRQHLIGSTMWRPEQFAKKRAVERPPGRRGMEFG